jgi:hypothetical protein
MFILQILLHTWSSGFAAEAVVVAAVEANCQILAEWRAALHSSKTSADTCTGNRDLVKTRTKKWSTTKYFIINSSHPSVRNRFNTQGSEKIRL